MIPMSRFDRVPAELWFFRPDRALVTDTTPRSIQIYAINIDTEPVWNGIDIARALNINVDTYDDEAITWHAGWETDDGLVPWIPTTYVRALAAERPDFLEFLSTTLEHLAAFRTRRHRLHLVGDDAEPTPLVDPRKETFSVVAAAQLLSRDPVLQYGRETLIDALRSFGWVVKSNDSNVPSAAAIAAGHLVRNDAWTAATRTNYNRVRVTRAGLTELHRLLGGVAELHVDAPAAPALI